MRGTITVDITDHPGSDILAVTALLDVLNHLEQHGTQPIRTTREIAPTTP